MPYGRCQPGGALLFMDHLLSPLAIHNNTFWHNYLVLAGHWRAGAQHLVFNNIVAQPDSLGYDFMRIDPQFTYRMHHSIYAAQLQKPSCRSLDYNVGRADPEGGFVEAQIKITAVDSVIIMYGMGEVEIEGMSVTKQIDLSSGPVDTTVFADWAILPGARITTPFGKNSTNRWFEMKFLSTDTASPDFLVPDWNDSDVVRLVLDQGWPDAGIIDADGSIADLGAIPKGGRALSNVIIQASSPVSINGTTADVTFDILGLQNASMNNLKIKYLRWIKNVVSQLSAFGSDCDSTIIPATSIIAIPAPETSLKMGTNNMMITIPSRSNREPYAFLEMIIEGTNTAGKIEVSSVGFIPYRNPEVLDVIPQNRIVLPNVQMKLQGGYLLTKFTNVGQNEPFILELFDVLGCRVANFPGNTSFTKKVNLSRLSSGSYYCRLNVNGITVKKSITLIK